MTVTATPACLSASAICKSGVREAEAGARFTLLRDCIIIIIIIIVIVMIITCMITNMSSMPIPRHSTGSPL